MEAIKKSTVVEQAIGRIYDLIREKNLKQGDRLPTERELSESLGISRNSLREAIRVLDVLGVLRVDQGVGTVIDASRISDSVTRHLSFAFLLNRDKLSELFEARLAIETECAGLAAERARPEDVAAMRAVHAELVKSAHDREKAILLELGLHDLVARTARNPVLESILQALSGVLKVSRETTVPAGGVTEETIESQARIVEAIAAHDARKARGLMRKHIAAVAGRLRAFAAAI